MNTIQLQYKRDTGCSPWEEEVESELMVNQYDEVLLEDYTQEEILDMIKNDKPFWGVAMEDVPEHFKDCDNLVLPSADYIKWLEEKVEEYQKQTV